MPSNTVVPDIENEVNDLLGDITQEQLEHEIEIIELQANTTLTPLDHDTLISETFSDADGYNDLVNTGNTTLSHSTNKYVTGVIGTESDSPGAATSAASVSYDAVINATGVFTKLKVRSANTAQDTTITIKKNGNVIYTKVHDQTSSDQEHDLALADYTDVLENTDTATIEISVGGTTMYIKNAHSYNGTYFDITSQTVQTGASGTAITFSEVITAGIVEIDLPTITGNVVATALVINGDDENTYYNITDGVGTDNTQTVGGIKNTLVNLSGNPTKLQVGLTELNKFVKSICLKLWKE